MIRKPNTVPMFQIVTRDPASGQTRVGITRSSLPGLMDALSRYGVVRIPRRYSAPSIRKAAVEEPTVAAAQPTGWWKRLLRHFTDRTSRE